MEDFELQEQHLSDAQAFDTLVGFTGAARIGGRNTKDCVHKVLDRLFTNSLMAKFNLKGKGKRGKRPLEGSKVYIAIQDGIMKFDSTATEDCIKVNVSEHLKHAAKTWRWRIHYALMSQAYTGLEIEVQLNSSKYLFIILPPLCLICLVPL
ncbi:hypothetical protein G5714_002571 [Onychostoma macrolepis]|uniref:DUF4806 domain-containing protein n=1 Tax=Onychostoma macrolepis TaxID=369639 RepID=A0A7J6D7F2_9TELE|nr:hypothetical protein G5714_002571 [Onychostoma macrolepis]